MKLKSLKETAVMGPVDGIVSVESSFVKIIVDTRKTGEAFQHG